MTPQFRTRRTIAPAERVTLTHEERQERRDRQEAWAIFFVGAAFLLGFLLGMLSTGGV